MPAVNPAILIWARETAGLSREEAVQRLGVRDAHGMAATDRLAAIEHGEAAPTRPLLVRMSKQYRRSLLAFYLEEVPRQGDRGEDFRTIPERHAVAEGLVDALIRDIRARQGMVRAILADDEEVTLSPFVGTIAMDDGVAAATHALRATLGFDLTEFRAQRSPESAFSFLRGKAEAAGVFVLLAGNLGSHHTAIDVEAFRGFALADDLAPFVVVNDRDAPTAWSFTLLHEMIHIGLGTTGVSGAYGDSHIERFCNDVAGNLLLPMAELAATGVDRTTGITAAARLIDAFAAERHVSRTMVAYRLLRAQAITDDVWIGLRNLFRTRWLQAREARRERDREGGPSYYVVRRHRLGSALLKFVARSLNEGTLSPTKAGKVLGVKARSVEPLLSGAALPLGQAA